MYGQILLLPYYITLKLRHFCYDHNFLVKTRKAAVPTISIGNLTVGGTGKTPHTELFLKTLLSSAEWGGKNIAVLSRGYKRKSKGFQIVKEDGKAIFYGDEPMQVKRKFPEVTVAVDKNRVRGCDNLVNPEKVQGEEYPSADLIILDDAFQYRKLAASLNVVLVDYYRPVFDDKLMPLGSLRDLPGRISKADVIIVTKCPAYMEDEEKYRWAMDLGISEDQKIFFTTIKYSQAEPVFAQECNGRYIYSPKVVLFSGIANDTPLVQHLCDKYQIVSKFSFRDHHKFSTSDIRSIEHAVKKNPTAGVATTQKDAQRVLDVAKVPSILKERLFQIPIEVGFLSEEEGEEFRQIFLGLIKPE